MMVRGLPIGWEAEPAQAPRGPARGWGSYHSLDGSLTGALHRAPSTKGTGITQAQWDASLSWTRGEMQLSSQAHQSHSAVPALGTQGGKG